MQDEKLLFNQVAEGDEIAFRAIYNIYFDRLTTYAFKMSKSEEVAEEIVQDIFLKLWVNRSLLKNIETPKAYIFSITRNKTIDYLRRLAKETNIIARLTEDMEYDSNSAVQQFDVQDLQFLITTFLTQLSPQKQKVFQLSKYDGFSHDEISEELKLSKSTIKNHLSETLQFLRKNLHFVSESDALLIIIIMSFLSKK